MFKQDGFKNGKLARRDGRLLETVVLDTSVLLEDPKAILSFPGQAVVIPCVVLEELDGKKHLHNELGRNAREVARLLDSLRRQGSLYQGIALENGGQFRIELNHRAMDKMDQHFVEVTNDNRILAVALNLAEENQVILISQDALMRVKADSLGVHSLPYQERRSEAPVYQGVSEVLVSPATIDSFYQNGMLLPEEAGIPEDKLYPNQYVVMKDDQGMQQSALGRFRAGKLQRLYQMTDMVWGIYPKNSRQRMAMELLLDDSVPLVTLSGRAGTGKTLLALAAGLQKTQHEAKYHKLLISRPLVPLGRDLGYLPGDKEEKLAPWIQPIYDNLEFLFNNRKDYRLDQVLSGVKNLEVEALTYVRGRSLPNQFIIIDEAQNLTHHEVKTIVSRVGENSKVVLVGDPEQIDHPYLDYYNNGLVHLLKAFKGEELAGHVHLVKGERSELADLATRLL